MDVTGMLWKRIVLNESAHRMLQAYRMGTRGGVFLLRITQQAFRHTDVCKDD
jgi:hypothetical protein